MGRNREWTIEEREYIEESWGNVSIQYIAKVLNRSCIAVDKYAYLNGLGGIKDSKCKLTTNGLADALNVDYHTVERWLDKKGLPYKNELLKKRKFRLIDIEQFWKWAEKNKEKLELRRYELGTLLPEPNWVKFEQKLQYKNKAQITTWSNTEVQRLMFYYNQGKSFKEIGEILGRTKDSIDGKLTRLRNEGRLTARKPRKTA